MQPLPVDDVLPEVAEALRKAQALVLVAPPGAGKTTRVPTYLLDQNIISGQIIMLEPRRVAARAVATRIAEERGGRLGAEVGYHVRMDRKASAQTKLLVITEGILTNRLQEDPFLEGVGLIVLDEFHERSIYTDMAVAFLRDVMEAREDLKVLVMSATLGADQIATFLNCSVIRSEGRLYPLDVRYRGANLFEKFRQSANLEPLVAQVQSAIHELTHENRDDGGDILVFLPGAREIEACLQIQGVDAELLPLHGSLSAESQDWALQKGDRRRVIFATNIAETSLTIPGVTAVIDVGLAKSMTASASTGFDVLELGRISKASATQRAGRAGRIAPGRVIRLWSEQEQHQLRDFELPEIHRVDLAGPVLSAWGWTGRSAHQFRWFEAPSDAKISRAERLLEELGAIEDRLTDVGQQMVNIALHPRLARCLIEAARRDCVDTVSLMVSILSEADFALDGPPTGWRSDVLWRVDLLHSPGRVRIHEFRRRQVEALARRLERMVPASATSVAGRDDVSTRALKCLAAGYPDRVCFRRQTGYAVSGGASLEIARESVLFADPPVILIAHTILDSSGRSLVRMASAFEEAWLVDVFPTLLTQAVEGVFDSSLGRVIARRVTRFNGLIIRSVEASTKDLEPQIIATALVEAAKKDWVKAFDLSEDEQQLLERLAFVSHHMPELKLPGPDSDGMRQALEQACWGKSSLSELSKVKLTGIVSSLLSYAQQKALDTQAPAALEVPSGRRHRLLYAGSEPPVLAVRIQELFGWLEVPRLADGRVAVTLHLLAPNYRPQQVTSDLHSFWKTTYPEVRKELRARYPKHAWPEDPFSAVPQARR